MERARTHTSQSAQIRISWTQRSVLIEPHEYLVADPRVEIVPLTEALYSQALILFRARPDKKWGLTDCISFVVMHERGIADALTTDEDFEQAGFRALLRASRL